MASLTKDGIHALFQKNQTKSIHLQVIEIQASEQKGELVLLSDGVFSIQCLVLQPTLPSGGLKPYCIINIIDSTLLQDQPVVVGCHVTSSSSSLIGNPSPYDPSHYGSSSSGNSFNTSSAITGGDVHLEPVDLSQLTPEPISALNTFNPDWVICAMVTLKSSIRTWKKPTSEGKFFSVTLSDNSAEIKMTFFTEQVDKFYNVLEERKNFFISKGKLQTANKRFNKTNHAFEITATSATLVQPAASTAVIPQKIALTSIGAIADCVDNDRVNLVGVIKSVSGVDELTSKKTGDTLQKRVVELCDRSRDIATSIDLTLWGESALSFAASEGQVLLVSDARKSSFNGVSLSSYSDTRISIDPDLPEARELHEWYLRSDLKSEVKLSQANFSSSSSKALSNRDPISALVDLESQALSFSSSDKSRLYVRATIQRVTTSRSLWYDACPSKDCSRKVSLQDDGKYHCLNGCYGTFDTSQKRFLLNVEIADATGSYWVTAFENVGEVLCGCSAQVLSSRFPNSVDPSSNSELPSEALQSFLQREVAFSEYLMSLTCRFEDDEVQGKRMRTIVSAAYPVVENRESTVLVKELEHSLQLS